MNSFPFQQLAQLLDSFFNKNEQDPSEFLVCQTAKAEKLYNLALKIAQDHGCSIKSIQYENYDDNPYGPILPWIRDELTKEGQCKLPLSKSGNIYHYHRPLLEKYCKGETVTRHEDILTQEFNFEKNLLINGLSTLFKNSHNGIDYCIIAYPEYMGNSGLELLYDIVRNKRPSNFGPKFLLITQNDSDSETENPSKSTWKKIIDFAESNHTLINISVLKNVVTKSNLETNNETLFRSALNHYHLLALDESKSILDRLHTVYKSKGFGPDQEQVLQSWKLYGMIQYLHQEYDLSLGSFQKSLSMAQQLENRKEIAELYYRIGLIYFEKHNFEYALNLAQQSLRISSFENDQRIHFYCLYLQFIIFDKTRTQGISDFRKFFHQLITLAKDLNFTNTQAFIATNPFGLYSDYNEEAEIYHSMGLKIARRAKNYYRLAEAYQTKGLVYSVKGEYALALTFYEKSHSIKKKINSNLELAFIKNGLGFYHYMTGNYSQANNFYKVALDKLRTTKEFDEIGMTIFNMSANFLLARNFETSLKCIDFCLQLMKILNFKHLPYHSNLGIAVLRGINLIKLGEITKAWQVKFHIDSNQLKPFPKKNEEYFLYHLFLALLLIEEQQFLEAEHYVFEKNDNIEYFLPFFYFEWGEFKQRTGYLEEARSYWEKGLNFAISKGNTWYNKVITDKIARSSQSSPILKHYFNLEDWYWILESARMHINIVNLHKKMEEIQYLHTFQTATDSTQNLEELTQRGCELLFTGLAITSIYVINVFKEQFNVLYQNENHIIHDTPLLDKIISLVRTNSPNQNLKSLVNHNLTSESYYMFDHMLYQEEGVATYLICIIKEKDLLSLNTDLLRFCSKQFSLVYQKIKQNQLISFQISELNKKNAILEKTATTDHLTNLGNRQALFSSLKREIAQIARLKNKFQKTMSLLFIDLDNFKFYNDTFGHAIGDQILIIVAQKLQELSRETDLIFRFGGDEFIIVLPDTPEHGALEVGKRIITGLSNQNILPAIHLLQNTSEALIPSEKQLSCSIGLTTYSTENEVHHDVQTLLKEGDEMLYKAKHNGKSGICFKSQFT